MVTKGPPLKALNARFFSEMVENNSHIKPQQTTPTQKCMPWKLLKYPFFFLILDKNWLYLFIYFVINSTLTCHQGSSEFRTEIFPIKGLQ